MTASTGLLPYFRGQIAPALEMLKRLVEMESFSLDAEGVGRLAAYLAGEFAACGAHVDLPAGRGGGNILKAVWHSGGAAKPVMLLGHLDTVWPRGTVAERPFRLEGGKAYGPGVFDMKASILVCLLVCRALKENLLTPDRDVIFFLTPDEETGSHGSVSSLESTAASCRAVFCLEPPLADGSAKTFRKGVGTFRLRATGLAAHAGVEPERGASAILELSRQILKLEHMNDPERGITVSVGVISGGSAVNVVPQHAEAEVDFRFTTAEEGKRLEKRMLRMRPVDGRCSLSWEGGINRPPLERTPAVAALFQEARSIAATFGMRLGEGSTGGGSDGSFTAALGIPTLDGLGVSGDGAHAGHEHVVVDDIPRRATLLGLLAQEVMK